ncbi:MAG: glycosyltransferase [Lachnospiraceae bacterium]|nr:glycosyltransferase [Lachnospiraceae bacterium]
MSEKADGKKPQISVIVPVHNGQLYLEGCIESIESQAGLTLEVIIVNDGSTDDTAAVCDSLVGRYDNLRVITLSDLGVSVARNRGLEQAEGEYITFVDADDRLRPGTLAGLYRILCETDADMAGCAFAVWSGQEEWKTLAETPEKPLSEWKIVEYNNISYLKDALLCGNSRCWSKLYKRSLIGKTRFREGLSIGEDMLFLVELLPRVQRAVEADYQGYGYYQNPNGAMKRPFTSAYMDQIYCWEMAKELILRREPSLRPQVNAQLMVAIMLVVGKIALLSGKARKEAEGYLRICREKLRDCKKEQGCYAFLPPGYGLKVRFFGSMPHFYVRLYHCRKYL